MDLDSVSSFSSLQALAKLLADPQEEDSDDSDFGSHSSSVSTVGPGNIGPAKKAEPTVTPDVKSGNRKDIWNTEEVPEGSEFDDIWDPREQPDFVSARYEILFKQQVGAEDIFLGMSRKNPSTACCEDMLIKIKLPDTKSSDITLDIQDKILDLRTPKKKLLLHLPHPVDSKNGKASFISEKETLEVTLRMKREFDFINFA
ncbi:dynein axonemal assembly factor 6 isoform X1 [Malaclemys terrapin pileata]|uniref:dynein axonemal assembly factor 6 isoform X1 n=1 Tax=Malaclemys terrapin pileata TaxID=2991368 RepID=UPI0023A7BA5B|nr:dynein axonemal assembly factor 6 isoform X1 [Malaclemys terrapin pileata]